MISQKQNVPHLHGAAQQFVIDRDKAGAKESDNESFSERWTVRISFLEEPETENDRSNKDRYKALDYLQSNYDAQEQRSPKIPIAKQRHTLAWIKYVHEF